MSDAVEPYVPRLRDKIAHRLASMALGLATPAYRNRIKGAIIYGLASAARDVRQDFPPPDMPGHENITEDGRQEYQRWLREKREWLI